MRARLAVALALGAWLTGSGCGPAAPSGLFVEARLRDGRVVTGRVLTETIPLTIARPGGGAVEIALEVPAGEIEHVPERGVYRIRANTFTAEALEIRSPLEIQAGDGKTQIDWGDILTVRFAAEK